MDTRPIEEANIEADPSFIASILNSHSVGRNASNASLRDIDTSFQPRSRGTSHSRPWDATSMHRPLDKLRTAYGTESIPLDHPLMPYIPPDTNFVDARHLLRPGDAPSWNWVVGLRNDCGPLDVALAAKKHRDRALRPQRPSISPGVSRPPAASYERDFDEEPVGARPVPPIGGIPSDVANARFARSTVASHGITGAPMTWSRDPHKRAKTKGNNWAEVGHILATETNTTGSKWALSLCSSRNRYVEPAPPAKYPGAANPPTHTLRTPGVPAKKKEVRHVLYCSFPPGRPTI